MMRHLALLICAILIPAKSNAIEAISTEEIVKQLSVPLTRSLGKQSFPKKALEENPDMGRIDLGAIQFEHNSSQLTPKAKQQVKNLAAAMEQLSHEKMLIVGHTDASGSDQYNMSLSERRAQSVMHYLVMDLGVDPARLQSKGEGEAKLKNTDNPRAAENRRVEVINSRVLSNY